MVRRPTRQAAKNHKMYKMAAESDSDEDDDFVSDSDESGAKPDDDDVSEATYEDVEDSDDELSSDIEPTPKKKPAKKRIPLVTCSITQTAPKIDELLRVIDEMKPDEKGVIFSQFTSFLNRIEKALDAKGHSFTRIDGSMNAASRIGAMNEFRKEDVKRSPRFILCSLRAAGTGINLTRANVAIMCDPWWNKAVESQAMDRVHRLGQKRKVRVYSLVMKDSIEERMISLQKSKAALGKGSMEKLSPREERRAKLTAMKDLFEIVDEADLNDSDDDFLGASFIDEAEAKESSDDSFIVDSDNEAVEVPLELSDENDSTGFSLGMFSDSSDEDLFSD
jgi:SNF2 family DNA or RNA helicase